MYKFLIILLTSFIVITSCSVQSGLKSRARTVNVAETDFYKKPLLGDVSVDLSKKISGIATTKELAIQQAVDAAGADFIIDPVFETIVSNASVSVKVIGYAGKYKEIKTATQEEMEALFAAEVGVGDQEILDMLNSNSEGSNATYTPGSGFPYRNVIEYEPAFRAERGIGERPLTGKEKRERNYYFFYYKSVEKRKAKGKKYNTEHPSVAREKSMKAGKTLLVIYAVIGVIATIILVNT